MQALLDNGWHCPRELMRALAHGGVDFAADALEPGKKRRKLSAQLHAFFTAAHAGAEPAAEGEPPG